MSENENKNTQNVSGSNNYSEPEIFDFDAVYRKSAQSQRQQDNVTPRQPSGSPRPPVRPAGTSAPQPPRQPSSPRANPNINMREKPLTPPSVTDVKPDRIVFDSSMKKRKLGQDKKIKKEKKIDLNKAAKKPEEKVKGSNPVTMLSKALIYIAAVLLVSVLCAYFTIVVSNDVFAFVKSDEKIDVLIPEYATLDEIADVLHEKNVIKYPKIFVLYTMVKKNNASEYLSGVFSVSPSQNYDELLSTFVKKKITTMTEISVTIPEGYTVDEIINLFVEKGMGTKEGFVDAIQNGEYNYWFIEDLKNLNPNRKYRLEGYLYPDTYYFYKEWEETKIINKMLANFYAKFSIQYKNECEKVGMSIDDVVNLASIIQMEAKYASDFGNVSSVIHNRLGSAYYNYRLDCDATIQYILPERKEDLTHEDTLIDNPYNTYKNGGLPPGPISNPTLKAIRAALYPEDTNYYFFISDINGYMLYGKNANEHDINIQTVEKQYADAKK